MQDSRQISKAMFLQTNWHIEIKKEDRLLWQALKELIELKEEQA
jgi:hypothetical protein